MGSWHVLSHFRVEASASFVLDTKAGIEELEQGALTIAAASVFSPTTFTITLVIENAVRQAS